MSTPPMTSGTASLQTLRRAAASVVDPEMPMLTLEDLGILRDVRVAADGTVEVDITPTYSGCPALEAIRDDVEAAVCSAGAVQARVRVVLAPAWSTDDISDDGLRKLHEHGIAPPAGRRTPDAPVPVPLSVRCPRCGSPDTRENSRFGPTACTALWTCVACLEPFEHVKVL